MSRYIRLGYLLPRLIGVVIVYFLLEFGADYALHRAVIEGGQSATGAKVEVEDTIFSLANSRAVLHGIQVANPEKPMENLIEADLIRLDMSTDALLRRRGLIELGEIKGLRFNTPRTTSGALEATEQEESQSAALFDITTPVKQASKRWAEGLESRLGNDFNENYVSVHLADELAEYWPQRYEEAEAEALALSQETQQLKVDFQAAKENPLRNARLLAELPQRATALQGELNNFLASLKTLPAELETDRARIAEARQQDEITIRQRFSGNQFDSDSLTNVLLGESVVEPVEQLVGWVRWTRNLIPSSKPKARTTPRDRGIDVLFAGVSPKADLLIQTLYLDGVASVGGRPIEFSGCLKNASSAPKLVEEPMTLALKSHSGSPMIVNATFDRSSDRPVDTLEFDCPELALPNLNLQAAGRMKIAMAPTQASLKANLQVNGQRISGVIQLLQQNVNLSASAGEEASQVEQQLAAAISQSLAHTSRAATSITLSGSLEKPGVAVSSTLGEAFSEALAGQAKQLLAQQRDRMITGLESQINSRVGNVDQMIHAKSQELENQLAGPMQEIRQLVSKGATTGGSWFERIGNQLPANGLTR